MAQKLSKLESTIRQQWESDDTDYTDKPHYSIKDGVVEYWPSKGQYKQAQEIRKKIEGFVSRWEHVQLAIQREL